MKIPFWQWIPSHDWRCIGVVESADDIPEKLPRNAAVMVASAGLSKWIAFDCPCRRGHRILLNTDPGRRPAWRVAQSSKEGLSIWPSVDYDDGRRRCHYFVRAGKIAWAKD
jgi:hypothetical protein